MYKKYIKTINTNHYNTLIDENNLLYISNYLSEIDPLIYDDLLPSETLFVLSHKTNDKILNHLQHRYVLVDYTNPFSCNHVIRLLKDHSIFLFPETKISEISIVSAIYDGFGYILEKSNPKIIPMAIDGTQYTPFGHFNQTNEQFSKQTINIYIDSIINENFKNNAKNYKANKIFLHDLLTKTKALIYVNDKPVNFFEKLIESAETLGYNYPILEDDKGAMTYKDLLMATYVFGDVLYDTLDVDENENVGVMLPNTNVSVITLFSFFRFGINTAMINFSQEFEKVIINCKTVNIKKIVTSKLFIDLLNLHPLIDMLKEIGVTFIYLEDIKDSITTKQKISSIIKFFKKDTSHTRDSDVILFTSGSTGHPKGIVHTHSSLYANVIQTNVSIPRVSDDKMLASLPFSHSFGLACCLLQPILSGMKIYVYPNPLDFKKIPKVVYENRLTHIMGSSFFIENYANAATQSEFRHVKFVSIGDDYTDELFNHLLEKFKLRIIPGYGMTEAGPTISTTSQLDFIKESRCRVVPLIETHLEKIKGLKDGGILHIKAPNLLRGKYIYQEGFKPSDEWFNTEDIVDIDNNKFLYYKGRTKHYVFMKDGVVSLARVDKVLQTIVKSDMFSSKVKVNDEERIVLFTTDKNITIEYLKKEFNERDYEKIHLPHYIHYVEEIPRISYGKPDHIKLQKEFLDSLDEK